MTSLDRARLAPKLRRIFFMLENRMEIMWGVSILDEGFTSIPNLIIRNYRKIGIEHGEFGFICQLLTYKHDTRDPYPSRATLANNMSCSERQIDKWVKSLRNKGLLRTGRRQNVHNKQWDNTVYNFKPLLDAAYRLIGETVLPDVQVEYEVVWEDDPCVPEVRMGSVPEVRMGSVPEVRTKKKSKNNNIKDDCMIDGANISEDFIPVENRETEKDIMDALNTYVPKHCYADNLPFGQDYIAQIFLMLLRDFPYRLSAEIVRMAAERYFDCACEVLPGGVVANKFVVKTPVGLFRTCYDEAFKLWKVQRNKTVNA